MWERMQDAVQRLRKSSNSGDRGEQVAAEWLRRERGFVVVARNWRNPRDRRQEIDLVCRDGEVLVFVEVKTRSPDALVPGYFAVDRRKKRVLLRAIRAYLARLEQRPLTIRFDIVEISLPASNDRASEVHHFESVSLFPKSFRG